MAMLLVGNRGVTSRYSEIFTPTRLRLVSTGTLRIPLTDAQFSLPAEVDQTQSGKLVVLDPTSPIPIRVFDNQRQLAVSVTTATTAPGLIRAIVITRGDSIHAFGRRHLLLDPLGRPTLPLGFPQQAVVHRAIPLQGGRFLVRADVETPNDFGYPFHVMTQAGALERSFGAGKSDLIEKDRFRQMGPLIGADSSHFWAAGFNKYHIDLWTTEGKLIRSIDRAPKWFTPWSKWDGRSDIAPPPPRLTAMWQDAKGRLWTLCEVAASDWKPVAGRSAMREAPVPTIGQWDGATDSMIEILDGKTGAVIASQRFKQTLIGFFGDGQVAGVGVDKAGNSQIGLWRIDEVAGK